MPHIQIIIGSTRPGRIGLPIAEWLMGLTEGRSDASYELVDLAAFALPVMNEPSHPRLGQYDHDHTKRWSDSVSRADGFVLVTPEYNHSYPASLKNALDYLHNEWRFKPAGFISYGGIAAGIRSVQHLKTVLEAFQMIPVLEGVNIPMVHSLFDAEKVFRPGKEIEDAARLMLDRVTFWALHQALLIQR